MGQRDLFERAARASELGGWLRLENFIAPGQRHPGLLAAGPGIRTVGRSQEVSSNVPDRTRHRPLSALDARKSNTHTLGRSSGSLLARFRRWFGDSRLGPHQAEGSRRYDHRYCERAAGQCWQSVQWHV